MKLYIGAVVVGAFEPNVAVGVELAAFVVAPNANIDGAFDATELVAVLAAVLADNAPKPTFALGASVGFVVGLPKLNEGAAEVV